jgi:hypothetical protein
MSKLTQAVTDSASEWMERKQMLINAVSTFDGYQRTFSALLTNASRDAEQRLKLAAEEKKTAENLEDLTEDAEKTAKRTLEDADLALSNAKQESTSAKRRKMNADASYTSAEKDAQHFQGMLTRTRSTSSSSAHGSK